MQYIIPVGMELLKYAPTVMKYVQQARRWGEVGARIGQYLPDYLAKLRDKYTTIDEIRRRYNRLRNLGRLPPARVMPLQTNVAGGLVLQRAPRTANAVRAHTRLTSRATLSQRLRQRNAYLRAVRRVRARRQIRAHYKNPRTNKRLLNKVQTRGHRQEAKIRSFKRRMKFRRRYRKRVSGWYKLGKWVLIGNYFNSLNLSPNANTIMMQITLRYINPYVFPNGAGTLTGRSSGGLIRPLGTGARVEINTAPYRLLYTFTPNVHFNIQIPENAASGQINNAILSSPIGYPGQSESTAPSDINRYALGHTQFAYSTDINNLWEGETNLVRMPPIPVSEVPYYMDPSAPYGLVDPQNPTNRDFPYLCYWKKVYFRISYSFKVSWPTVWSAQNIMANFNTRADGTTQTSAILVGGFKSGLPPNPPLYIRLFCTRSLTSEGPSYEGFIRALFPNNSPITSGFQPGYRKNLWNLGKTVLVWHRLWMFNGQITPQFQSQENLTDGEEGHFNLGVRYKTHNYYEYPFIYEQGAHPVLWPTPKQIGFINFFAVAGFLSPQFTLQFRHSSQQEQYPGLLLDDMYAKLEPSFSATFNFEACCYPKLHKPNPKLPKQWNTNSDIMRSQLPKSGINFDKFIEKFNPTEENLELLEKSVEAEVDKKDEEIQKEEEENNSDPDEPDEITADVPALA